jgi:hypothetical protein
VLLRSVWITGATRSGKTTQLVAQFGNWVQVRSPGKPAEATGEALVLAAIGDNQLELRDRLTTATQGRYPFRSTTPLGFFADEVTLFWPLLVQQLDLKAQFPVKLRPENEQELATRLWRPELDQAVGNTGVLEAKLVRRILDLLQLATLSGMPIADLPTILSQGLIGDTTDGLAAELPIAHDTVGEMLQRWRDWCLQRGLLTYSLIAELYDRLLADPRYQDQLQQRYRIVLADDVDEFPAIARHLFDVMLDQQTVGIFTFNPDGAIRQGLGADPNYLRELADRCRLVHLDHCPVPNLAAELGESVWSLVANPVFFTSLPDRIQALSTTTRAQLLRQTSALIITAVQTGQLQPRDIAIIGPGLDGISRYTLTEILTRQGIPVESLNDQRPLASSPIMRSLLTLLALIYPGLGRLVSRDPVAEMLVVLSQQPSAGIVGGGHGPALDPATAAPTWQSAPTPNFLIDPVRAGLLADHCFEPHPDRPRLLPAQTFPRWDRLGYQATTAYSEMMQWVEGQRSQLEQRLIASPVVLLDRAIQRFFDGGSHLPFDQLAALRELIETAQHYWEVDLRLRQSDRSDAPPSLAVNRFIQLLRQGTVTANPFPVKPIGPASNAVTLSTVFQYRASRRSHRWQFWFDAGSSRWLSGIDALFGAPLFLQSWSGQPWTVEDTLTANEQRLRRILLDLLGRTEERVYLCYSDLATNGQEQTGALMALVNAAVPIGVEPLAQGAG